jgi:hypothetical protein
VAWLWSDILAALLVESDQVAAARVADWVERPVAYRLADDGEPLDLARALLERTPATYSGEGRFRPR